MQTSAQTVISCKPQGCGLCQLVKLKTFTHSQSHGHTSFEKKAGVFIHDSESNRVLVIQSRGNLWGLPKGTFNKHVDNDLIDCALRELYEETGIRFNRAYFLNKVTKHINIGNCVYYYINCKQTELQPKNLSQLVGETNDISGIGWINIACTPFIKFNYHFRKSLIFFT